MVESNTKGAIQRVNNYPDVPWPSPPLQRPRGNQNQLKSIKRLVNSGRLGTAASLVREEVKVAEVDNAVVASLGPNTPLVQAIPLETARNRRLASHLLR